MAEPARNPEDQNSVYDEPSGVAPSNPKPDLKVLEGGGETSQPKQGHLREVGSDNPSKEDISESESSPDTNTTQHDGQLGRGYRSSKKTKKKSRFSRSQKVIAGGAGGILGGTIIALFLFLFPALRLDSYLSNINQRVFGAANNAVSKRIENLFESYLSKRIFTIQKCGNVVSSDCKTDYSQEGIAKNLFNAWQDARVENTLFDKFGLEVQSMKKPINGQYYKIIDVHGRWSGSAGTELTINKDGELVMGKFTGGSRIFGQSWSDFISNETRWSDVMQRISVRKYLSRAHGTKFWCLFACEQKDAIDNAKISAKAKLQYKLLEKVVYPFTPKYALIMKCLVSADPSVCSPSNLDKTSLDTSQLSDKDIQDLQDFSQRLEKEPGLKLSQIAIEQILIKSGMDELTAKSVTSAVPLVGQIYLVLSAAEAMEGIKTFAENGELNKIAANLTSEQYVQYYSTMRTANDEIKSGSLPTDEVGALNSQFDDGGHSAEQSLVYQAYNSPKPTTASASSNSPISSLFGKSKVLADATTPPYVCSNGQPIPTGQLVCPEKTLNHRGNQVTDFFASDTFKTMSSLLDRYDHCYEGFCLPFGLNNPHIIVHKVLGAVNWLINGVLQPILSVAFDAIKVLPGVNNLLNFATNEAGKLIMSLFKEVFPLPLQPDSPGIDKYNALEAGGEITASEFNKGGITDSGQSYGLGGQLLTDQQQSDASHAYLTQQDYSYRHSSIVARLTNISNPNSPLSRFIAAMPTTWNEFSSNVFSFISNPFKNFGAIWHPAYATPNTAAINAFGVPRFGYVANDPAFKADPSIYTPEYCQQVNQKWQATKTQDPVTGIDEYSTTNPCLLEQVSVESASSAFTQNQDISQ